MIQEVTVRVKVLTGILLSNLKSVHLYPTSQEPLKIPKLFRHLLRHPHHLRKMHNLPSLLMEIPQGPLPSIVRHPDTQMTLRMTIITAM